VGNLFGKTAGGAVVNKQLLSIHGAHNHFQEIANYVILLL
jgi:hypothetical protein